MTRTTTIALHKPYGYLSRFTGDGSPNRALAEIEPRMPNDVYPVGRLDADSEGLLVSSDKRIVDSLLDPKRAHARTYLVEVDRVIDDEAVRALAAGVAVQGRRTLPATAARLDGATAERAVPWPRDPPVRLRKNVPTSWIALALVEGKNRQVRRMTAAVGFPTLRLVRWAIGTLSLADLALAPGQWRTLSEGEVARLHERPRGGLVLPG
jgi:23S rRNA pseudouridine2457 synthase